MADVQTLPRPIPETLLKSTGEELVTPGKAKSKKKAGATGGEKAARQTKEMLECKKS